MIRQLAASDEALLAAACGRAPELSVMMLANRPDLANETDLVAFWGEFSDAGDLTALLMRCGTLWYIHVEPNANSDLPGLASLLRRSGQERMVLNGLPRVVSELHSCLPGYEAELRMPGRLRCLRGPALLPERSGLPTVRRATLDDLPALDAFYAAAPQDVRRDPECLRRSVAGGRRTFVAERGRAVTACALTTAELPDLALADGLHGEGRMWDADLTAVLGALCTSLQADGKGVCAVTRDLWIDRICDSLGFVDLSPWLIIHARR